MPADNKNNTTDDPNFDEFLKKLSLQNDENDSLQPANAADGAINASDQNIDALRDQLAREVSPANEEFSSGFGFDEPGNPGQSPLGDVEISEEESFRFDDRLSSLVSETNELKADSETSVLDPALTHQEIGTDPNAEEMDHGIEPTNPIPVEKYPDDLEPSVLKEFRSPLHYDDPDDDSNPWNLAENRLSELQQNFKVDISERPEIPKKNNLMEALNSEDGVAHPIIRVLFSTMGLVILLLIGVIGYFLFNPVDQPPATPIPLENPISSPYPVSLEMFGVTAELKIGQLVDNVWTPTDAEWLKDTEICRVISLPTALKPEDISQKSLVGSTILLTMSNGDKLAYVVKDLRTTTWHEFTEYSKDANASLVVGYYSDSMSEVLLLYAELTE